MSRTKAKTKSKAGHDRRKDDAPRAEQLAAVRRLLEHGHVAQARQQCAAATPVSSRCTAWPARSRSSRATRCALRPVPGSGTTPRPTARWRWSCWPPARRPRISTPWRNGPCGNCTPSTRVRTAPPPATPQSTPLGPLSFEQGMALDLGRMHMGDDHFEEAVEVLRGVDHPTARNNHALALFHCGDVRGAQALAEAAWQANHDNLFALDHSLRWRCWLEGMAPCRSEDAIARVSALRFLGDEEGAGAAWEDSGTRLSGTTPRLSRKTCSRRCAIRKRSSLAKARCGCRAAGRARSPHRRGLHTGLGSRHAGEAGGAPVRCA